jgi:glutathione peroxidase
MVLYSVRDFMPMTCVFDFSAASINGHQQPLADYSGKVLLIVNVASRCGLTPQYGELEQLWQQYSTRGLVVLGFPCDQFGHQEPGGAQEIAQFCALNYAVSFPMFAKVEVNGANAHPLWGWLVSQRAGILGTRAIKWNFSKFLLGRDGQVRGRYAPMTSPRRLVHAVERALG